MRTGGYTIQQTLSSEAASLVKQALTLARRRGHAQVTPLHVAFSMLSSSTGLFRRACLQTHSHPLQFKALELCFNVALNRLPTSTSSSPILGHHPHHLPSLSNALVAAFKRAQAYQRRGSMDNQQPILALKVEIEQLVISILDDPSVSRVMREAGFSSTQVKANVEKAISLIISSKSPSISTNTTHSKETKPLLLGSSLSQISHTPTSHDVFRLSLGKTVIGKQNHNNNDDVMSLISTMMNRKKKNTVIIAEYPAAAEAVLRGAIDKFDKGEVPGDIKHVQFVSVPLYTLRNIRREEFEHKLGELRGLVKGYINRGVVLYLGDLQWVSEFWSKHSELRYNYYSPVEHMIMELNRLACGVGESGKVWLMGVSTFKTFSNCKSGHPSLETLWDLHPLTVPVCSLNLSLNFESSAHGNTFGERSSSWLVNHFGMEKHLNCCADCLDNFNKEAKRMANSSSLPAWLQKCKEEDHVMISSDDQEYDKMKDLCKKWNSICRSVHKQPHFLEKAFNFSSSTPSSSASISSNDKKFPMMFQPNNHPITKEHKFFISDDNEENDLEMFESKLIASKPDLLSNPNSSPNSASSSEASGDDLIHCLNNTNRFNEVNSDNLRILCNALEKKVPWQRDVIPEIATRILQCRSGMMIPQYNNNAIKRKEQKQETWLLFSGDDSEGKEKAAREIARVVFGTQDEFFTLSLSSFSSLTKVADYSTEDDEVTSKKRSRNEHGQSFLDRFAEAVRDNPSRVFFMEDFDQIENHSQKAIIKAIESGILSLHNGESCVSLKDAIVIFSCDESFSSSSRKQGDRREREQENGDIIMEEMKPCTTFLDLNISLKDGLTIDETSHSEYWVLDYVDKKIIFNVQVL
ncbi:hypothetical protein Leryth_008284 [Lithospermum erythrorhizon]|nr:hypothetical protein Leryth_008284 [Lithospermum erythrorhizon]